MHGVLDVGYGLIIEDDDFDEIYSENLKTWLLFFVSVWKRKSLVRLLLSPNQCALYEISRIPRGYAITPPKAFRRHPSFSIQYKESLGSRDPFTTESNMKNRWYSIYPQMTNQLPCHSFRHSNLIANKSLQ